jgi:BirA family biotin operon repressor/biotin-[acetyl-CoA-carboxylase] ligase
MTMYFNTVKNFGSLSSTNLHLREMLHDDPTLPGGLVICTSNQTSGKGRFDRKWITPPGECLTFSALVRMDVPPEYLLSLPLVAGVAVVETLEELGITAKLKWPNDVLVGGKKICGILCESVPMKNGAPAAIIGVGLNVNLSQETADAIEQPATSMFIEKTMKFSISGMLDLILETLDVFVEDWSVGGCEAIDDTWLANTDDIGMDVEVRSVAEIFHGKIAGLGNLGQLIVTDSDGLRREVFEGDVKVVRSTPVN